MLDRLLHPGYPAKGRIVHRHSRVYRPNKSSEIHDLEALARAHLEFSLQNYRVELSSDNALKHFLCVTKPEKNWDDPQIGQPVRIRDWRTRKSISN